MFICRQSQKKKCFVLELGELEYSINKIITILCLCFFVDNPKKKKKLQGTQDW